MITVQQATALQELEGIILDALRTQDYSGCIGRLHFKVDLLRKEIKDNYTKAYLELCKEPEREEVIKLEEGNSEKEAGKEAN